MKCMRWIVFLLIATFCRAGDIPVRVDEYINAHVERGSFSGSVLIARDGKAIVSKGYGMANLELEAPNTPATKFRLGSITKQFTAALVLRLAERGKLKTDDPVCKYVAECPPAWEKVTIHHLLTHTSGIPSLTSFPDYRKTMMLPSPVLKSIARFRDKPLEFAPGKRYKYSNSGYILLGYIVEKASGQDYEAHLTANILDPLGMNDTGYDHHDRILPRRASGYSRRRGELVNCSYLDMSIPHGAGALYSTVEDLLKWDQALYTEKVLKKESIDRMFTPNKGNYGYGWNIRRLYGRAIVAHGGGIEGFSAFIARYPEEKVCVVALSNRDFAGSGGIARDLSAIVFGEDYRLPRDRAAVRIDPGTYDRYTGRYKMNAGGALTVSREGDRLMTQAPGRPRVEIFPESETVFFYKARGATITFVVDESGIAQRLLLRQGFFDAVGRRIKE